MQSRRAVGDWRIGAIEVWMRRDVDDFEVTKVGRVGHVCDVLASDESDVRERGQVRAVQKDVSKNGVIRMH